MEDLNSLISLTHYSAAQLLSIALQVLLFTSAISHLIISILTLLHFSYATKVANSRVIQIGAIFLFIHFRGWGTWHPSFVAWGYLSGIIVSLYTSDCCCNIANSYVQNVRGFYYGQVIFYICFTMLLPFFYLFQNQNPIIFYILLVEIAFITLLNALRKRHIFNAAVVSLTTLMVPVAKLLLSRMLNHQYLNRLPLEVIPILMMALDAEYREGAKQEKGKDCIGVKGEVLKSCCLFLGYAAVNGHSVHIEVMIPIWILILILAGRDIS